MELYTCAAAPASLLFVDRRGEVTRVLFIASAIERSGSPSDSLAACLISSIRGGPHNASTAGSWLCVRPSTYRHLRWRNPATPRATAPQGLPGCRGVRELARGRSLMNGRSPFSAPRAIVISRDAGRSYFNYVLRSCHRKCAFGAINEIYA